MVRDSKGKSSGTERDHLKAAARGRSKSARAARDALKNPHPFPEGLRYLYEWALHLYGRSGFSEVGVSPLSWQTIAAWQQATGRDLTPREVDALFQIDAALSYRGEEK